MKYLKADFKQHYSNWKEQVERMCPYRIKNTDKLSTDRKKTQKLLNRKLCFVIIRPTMLNKGKMMKINFS
jgi:hypothetical protein